MTRLKSTPTSPPPQKEGILLRLAYTLLGLLITPLLGLWLLRRAAKGKERFARLGERFGHAKALRPEGTLIWLHAASVGEAQSVLTLVRALLTAHPHASMLITTGTVTSAALVAAQHLPRTTHQFFPVDTFPAVRTFLRHWKPDLVLWVESEFWPQMLWQIRARRIPAVLINARISAATAQRWKAWPATIGGLLACFDTRYAGSTNDAERLRALGGGMAVQDAGNLKYDAAPLPVDDTTLDAFRAAVGGRPVWVAASTHATEEARVAELHRTLCARFPDLLTVIIPRHAVRGAAIAQELRDKKCCVAQRSTHEPITPETGIYLADTMGELGLFFRAAPIAFLGGSLIAHGGHNPLEPARMGCAILTGPHVHNFADIVAHLEAARAITVVPDAAALESQLAALLADPEACAHAAQRAQALTDAARGASTAILTRIAELLPHAHA